MDSGVNELEFSTLRSLRTHPALPDQDVNGISAVEQPRSRQVSTYDKGAKSSDKNQDIVVDQDGVPREVLIAPPKPPSDLELDAVSQKHLQTLIRQSVENVGLQDRSWEVSHCVLIGFLTFTRSYFLCSFGGILVT